MPSWTILSVLVSMLLPAMGCRRDSGRLSYGIYCFSAAQKPETKRFVQYMKEAFSPS